MAATGWAWRSRWTSFLKGIMRWWSWSLKPVFWLGHLIITPLSLLSPTDAKLNANLDHIKKNSFEWMNHWYLCEFGEPDAVHKYASKSMWRAAVQWAPDEESKRYTGFNAMLTDPYQHWGAIIADSFLLPTVYFLNRIPCWLDKSAAQCPLPPSFVPCFFTSY